MALYEAGEFSESDLDNGDDCYGGADDDCYGGADDVLYGGGPRGETPSGAGPLGVDKILKGRPKIALKTLLAKFLPDGVGWNEEGRKISAKSLRPILKAIQLANISRSAAKRVAHHALSEEHMSPETAPLIEDLVTSMVSVFGPNKNPKEHAGAERMIKNLESAGYLGGSVGSTLKSIGRSIKDGVKSLWKNRKEIARSVARGIDQVVDKKDDISHYLGTVPKHGSKLESRFQMGTKHAQDLSTLLKKLDMTKDDVEAERAYNRHPDAMPPPYEPNPAPPRSTVTRLGVRAPTGSRGPTPNSSFHQSLDHGVMDSMRSVSSTNGTTIEPRQAPPARDMTESLPPTYSMVGRGGARKTTPFTRGTVPSSRPRDAKGRFIKGGAARGPCCIAAPGLPMGALPRGEPLEEGGSIFNPFSLSSGLDSIVKTVNKTVNSKDFRDLASAAYNKYCK
jgi:hypothetical protein